jgi:hypothetical protein
MIACSCKIFPEVLLISSAIQMSPVIQVFTVYKVSTVLSCNALVPYSRTLALVSPVPKVSLCVPLSFFPLRS